MRSCDENHDLLCVHDGADPDGERLLGNGREVAVEEAGVGLDGVLEGGGGKEVLEICSSEECWCTSGR